VKDYIAALPRHSSVAADSPDIAGLLAFAKSIIAHFQSRQQFSMNQEEISIISYLYL